MGSKLKNKKFIIMIGIVILVISTGVGVYLYKENHDSIVMDIIVNYKNELSKNSIEEDKEYSEEDLQNLKTKLEEVLKNVENKKSTMEILWGDYTQYDKLVENIKCEVKTIDERIIKVKKDAEQKAKEEAEKKAEEERKAQEIANGKVNQPSSNTENNSANSSNNSSNSGNSSGNSQPSNNSNNQNNNNSNRLWNDGYRWAINEKGQKIWINPETLDTYDENGNWLYNGNNPIG